MLKVKVPAGPSGGPATPVRRADIPGTGTGFQEPPGFHGPARYSAASSASESSAPKEIDSTCCTASRTALGLLSGNASKGRNDSCLFLASRRSRRATPIGAASRSSIDGITRTDATSSGSPGPPAPPARPLSPQLGSSGATLGTPRSDNSSAVRCHHHAPSRTHAPCTNTTLIVASVCFVVDLDATAETTRTNRSGRSRAYVLSKRGNAPFVFALGGEADSHGCHSPIIDHQAGVPEGGDSSSMGVTHTRRYPSGDQGGHRN